MELGILGYRICFVSPQQAKAIAGVTRFDQLKQYQNVRGRGWQDVAILRAAGFPVSRFTRVPSKLESGYLQGYWQGRQSVLRAVRTVRAA